MNHETCDVLPFGYLDGSMSASETYHHIRSGAIPSHYVTTAVRERLTVIGWVFLTTLVATFIFLDTIGAVDILSRTVVH